MKSNIEKLARSFMGDKFNSLSGTDKRWVEMNFGRDYESLNKIKLVNDFYEEMLDRDYRGLLNHLEESAGMEALAEGVYNENPDFFDSLFEEEIEVRLKYNGYDTIDSIVEGRNLCIHEVEYSLRKFRELRNFYHDMN
ncbi:hypothetical protein KY334_00385 [Candidatus Woesearchaeota archaeon]|nr:hypothetical protein [Candidatus Woesearchaeota archaeon]